VIRALKALFAGIDGDALAYWLQTVGVTALVAIAVAYLISALRYGPLTAGDHLYSVLSSAVGDLVRMSPRRVAAMAWLAVKESVRQQVIAGLVIFGVVLAFALWFLDTDHSDPSALYISFVMDAVNYLILLLAIFVSAYSLPNDLKRKTIYTIVTKPVRPSEIVLGRILGFIAVCTVPLALMGLGGYFFVVRALDHTHDLSEESLHPFDREEIVAGADPNGKQGMTSTSRAHRHRVLLDASGNGITETDDARIGGDQAESYLERFGQSHRHRVKAVTRDGRTEYEVGPPEGQLHARVPIHGRLTFKDAVGNAGGEGYNVGNWTKRGYVAGGTLSAGVFHFERLDPDMFPDGLRLQLNIRLFRTTKEDIDKPILGSIVLRSPLTGLTTAPRNFSAREFFTLDYVLPRKLTDASGKPIDLFADLARDGRLEVELQCIPRSQFFGIGPEDVYLLAAERRFDVNFAKGVLGIWLQMALTVTIGVFWSTFLSGPVAMLAGAASIVAAIFKPTLLEIVRGEMFGTSIKSSGMLEAAVRLATQKATMQELDEGASTRIIKGFDAGLNWLMEGLFRFVPDFSAMSDAARVAGGFDIPASTLLTHQWQTLGFAVPVFLAAFIIFKLTEVAKA
jgi:hypothetical protein